MAAIGKLLQLIGLTVPPLSIVLQLNETITSGRMLIMLIGSVAAFLLGRMIEGYSR